MATAEPATRIISDMAAAVRLCTVTDALQGPVKVQAVCLAVLPLRLLDASQPLAPDRATATPPTAAAAAISISGRELLISAIIM
jgi:hypothetical protein